MKTYELLIILNPKLTEENVESFVGNLEKTLANDGAEFGDKNIEPGKRLSYPIRHQTTGHFIKAEISASPEVNVADKINQHLVTNEDVLRKVLVTQTEKAKKKEGPVSVIDQLRHQDKMSRREAHPEAPSGFQAPQEATAPEAAPETETTPEKEKADIKELDKKIEELLT